MNEEKIFIGVDPGLSGAVAVIDSTEVRTWLIPLVRSVKRNEIDCVALAKLISEATNKRLACCCCELVGARPGQGVVSMFRFGEASGLVRGICYGLSIPVVLVTPQTWKKTILAGFDWKGRKAASVEYCQARYPHLNLLPTKRSRKPHDGMADAVCMAERCRLMYAQ